MENASKALIIAGAILLAIAIIGIGMYVYQMAAGVVGQANMSGSEVAAYNAEFMKYEGTQTGTAVKTLYDVVRQHNSYQDDPSKKVRIWVYTNDYTGTTDISGTVSDDTNTNNTDAVTLAKSKSYIKSGSKYYVTFAYTSSGLVKCINIRPKK